MSLDHSFNFAVIIVSQNYNFFFFLFSHQVMAALVFFKQVKCLEIDQLVEAFLSVKFINIHAGMKGHCWWMGLWIFELLKAAI